jgi:TP901 family phage tail tape measure protein
MSSITHDATIHLNLDFVDSSGLKQLKAAMKSVVDALDMTKFSARVEKLEQELSEAKAQVMAMTGSLKQQAVAQEKVVQATEKQIKAQKAADAAARRAISIQKSTLSKFQGAGAGEIPSGLAGARKQRLTGMATSLKTLKTAMADTEGVSERLARGMAEVGRKTAEAAKKTQDAKNAYKILGAAIDASKGKGKQYQEQLKQIKSQYAALAGQESKNIDTIKRLIQKVQELEAAEKQHQQSLKTSLKYRLSYYEQQMDAIFRASYRMQQAGRDMLNFGRSIFNGVTQMMSVFGEFEYTLSRAAGSLEIFTQEADGAKPGMIQLQNAVLDTSVALRMMPAAEVAQGLYYWGSATGTVIKTTEDLKRTMQAVEPIMQAALMTGTSYETTVKGVYSILTQFYHGSIAKAADVTRELFYVTQKTAVEFQDLIQSFKMVGPVAAQNNTTFEELVEVFGRLGDLGVRGTMAGRAFRQVFIQLLRPSARAKESLTSLFAMASQTVDEFKGKSYVDIMFPRGKFVGVTKYIHNLALAMRDLSATDRQRRIAVMATATEVPVLTALIEDEIATIKGLNATTKESGDISTRAREYFEKNWNQMSNTWKGVTGLVQRLWESLKIQIGSVVSEALKPFLENIGEIVQKMREWATDPANRQLIASMSKLAVAVAAIAAVGGAALIAVGALMRLVGVIYVITRSFAPLVSAVVALGGAFVALTDSIIRNWSDVQGAIEHVADAITGAFSSQEDAANSLGEVLNSLLAPTQYLFDIIVKLASGAIELAAGFIELASSLHILQPVLKAIVTLLGAFIAARTAVAIAGLVGRIGILSRAFAMLRVTMLATVSTQEQMFFSKYGAAQAATGIRGMISGIGGIRGALTGLLATLGPIGIAFAAIGLGAAAYESDFLGFKGLIDNITDAFRDVNKEVEELTGRFGDLGDSISKSAQKLAGLRMAYGATTRLGASISETVGGTYNPRPHRLDYTDESGKQQFETFYTYEEAVARLDELTTKYTANMMAKWEKWGKEISRTIGRTVDDSEFTDVLNRTLQGVDLSRMNNQVDADLALQGIVATILRDKTSITNKVEAKKLYDYLVENYKGIFTMGWEQFSDWVASPAAVLASKAAAEQSANALLYKPVTDTLLGMLERDASPEAIVAFLKGSTNTMSWARRDPLINALLMHLLPPETEQWITDELERRGIDLRAAAFQGLEGAYNEMMQSYTDMNQAISSGTEITKAMGFKGFMDAQWGNLEQFGALLGNPEASAEQLDEAAQIWLNDFKQGIIDKKFMPETARILIEAAEGLIGHGGLSRRDVEEARKGLEEAVKADTRSTIQIINDTIKAGTLDALNEAGQGTVQTWMSNIATMAFGTIDIAANLDKARSWFMNQLLPLLQTTELDAETKQAVAALGQSLFPDQLWSAETVDSIMAQGKGKIVSFVSRLQDSASGLGRGLKLPSLLEMERRGYIGIANEENAAKSRRDWIDQFVQSSIPTAKEIAAAIKKIPSGDKVMNQIGNALMSKSLAGALRSRTSAKREYGRDTADQLVDTLTAQYNAGSRRRRAKIRRAIGNMLDDPKLPDYVRTRLSTLLSEGVRGVEIVTPEGETDKPKSFIDNILTNFGLGQKGKTTEKKPANVYLRVHMKQAGSVRKTTAAVLGAYQTISQTLTDIDNMGWGKVGDDAGTTLAQALVAGVRSRDYRAVALGVRSQLNSIEWRNGGYASGFTWARGFNDAVVNTINKTLTFVASVTIGNSPPPNGPLSDIDRGGANAGYAWADGFGNAARERLLRHAADLRNQKYAERLSLTSDDKYEAKKEIDIHLDVTSKDGSVDRAKQGEFRRGMMDVMVAADLEHYVTVS